MAAQPTLSKSTNPIAPQSKPDPKTSTQRCIVDEVPEGHKVTFLVDENIAKRITTRAGKIPLHRYYWENILNRAVTDHVY